MRIYIKFHGGRVTLIDGNTGGGGIFAWVSFVLFTSLLLFLLHSLCSIWTHFRCIAFRLIFGLVFFKMGSGCWTCWIPFFVFSFLSRVIWSWVWVWWL